MNPVGTYMSACAHQSKCMVRESDLPFYDRQIDSTVGSRLSVLDPCNLIAVNLKPSRLAG